MFENLYGKNDQRRRFTFTNKAFETADTLSLRLISATAMDSSLLSIKLTFGIGKSINYLAAEQDSTRPRQY